MYEYISGKLAGLTPSTAVVDCGGVGYLLEITLSTYSAIQGRENVHLWVHESVREDAFQLFGFVTGEERQMFRLLTGVNGVGAQTARMMLSALSAEELSEAIARGDTKRVASAKGIGKKMAERIVLELRDKVMPGGFQEPVGGFGQPSAINQNKEEALSALVMLGFPKAASEKVLGKLDGSLTVEALIKEALKRL